MLQFYARVVVELGITVCAAPVIGERNLVVLAGSDARITFSIQTRRMHGIVGERERSNCVVDMRCI